MLHLKQIKQLQEPLWKWQLLSFIFEYTRSRIINIRHRRNTSPKKNKILSSFNFHNAVSNLHGKLYSVEQEKNNVLAFLDKIKQMGSNVVL